MIVEGGQVVLLKAANRIKSLFFDAVSEWPLTARVPMATGLLIFIVGIAISHVSMVWIFHEQKAVLHRLSDVYLDGVATAILPAVAAGDAVETTAALKREFLFDEGMREFELIVQTPKGAPFARVAVPGEIRPGLDDRILEALQRNRGFVINDDKGAGWGYRELVQDDRLLARIYAEIDLSDLQNERLQLRVILAVFTLAASGLSALLGFVVIKHMVQPLHTLTARLERAHCGALTLVPEAQLPSATTEFGRLLRGFNAMIGAIVEREELAAGLAAREQVAVLGRLAATVAHEVHNPLGGMFNAVDTGRKFGHDEKVRSQSFDLIERGLWSIRSIVGALLASHRVPQDRRALAPEDLDDLRILVDPEARRIRVDLEWQSTIDRRIPVSATQVRQIGLNLLLNACAVSGDGQVRFAAELDDGAMRLQVEDDGPGLPDRVKAALDGGVPDGRLGLAVEGIGLSVVNRLVQDLGGSIVARPASTTKGARITVTIPFNEASLSHVAPQ
jgi:signal transduction histidine kinase